MAPRRRRPGQVPSEATGAGNVHRDLVPGIRRALGEGVPVVVTTRCATGSVSPTYGGPGGGHEVAALGCILGGDLSPHKARLALWVALGQATELDGVRRWSAAFLR
jgi:L-asparaginase